MILKAIFNKDFTQFFEQSENVVMKIALAIGFIAAVISGIVTGIYTYNDPVRFNLGYVLLAFIGSLLRQIVGLVLFSGITSKTNAEEEKDTENGSSETE